MERNYSDEIKNELQGSGFLEEVKKERLPGSKMLTAAALEKYEANYASLNPNTICRQADTILQRLLEFEQEIYQEREQRVYRQALVVFLEEKYDNGQTSLQSFADDDYDMEEFADYPRLQEMFSEVEEIYNTADGFEAAFSKILPLLYPAMDAISVSAQQSRRKRAGSSLSGHVDNLLEKAGYTIDDIQSAGNGRLYQISQKAGDDRQSATIYLSFITTLRDRFRQSISDSSINDTDLSRFIITGAGNSIFSASGKSGVTEQKVEEIANEGFTLVVFENVKQNEHSDNENVITYRQFFSEELPAILE